MQTLIRWMQLPRQLSSLGVIVDCEDNAHLIQRFGDVWRRETKGEHADIVEKRVRQVGYWQLDALQSQQIEG